MRDTAGTDTDFVAALEGFKRYADLAKNFKR